MVIMKKIYLLFLLIFLPLLASADAVEINGIYYNLVSKAKIAEVTKNPNKYSGKVTIPKTINVKGDAYVVKTIGEEAFKNCTNLTSVSLPSSIVTIGSSSFYDCTNLASITIPDNTKEILWGAFSGCTSITKIKIPNSVEEIGYYAFSRCSKLTAVEIGESVKTLGLYAFSQSDAIEKVVVLNISKWCQINFMNSQANPLYYAKHIYLGNQLSDDLILPKDVESIANYAFVHCKALKSLVINDDCKHIGDSSFEDCSNLESVVLGNKLESIGYQAFRFCTSLHSIDIPKSVTKTGGYSFMDCSGLIHVKIGNSLESISIGLFKNCSKIENITLGAAVNEVCESAFENCPELINVYCCAKEVPNTYSDAFKGSYVEYATLHVPVGCIDAFKAAAPWSSFKNIVEIVGVELDKTEVSVLKGNSVTLTASVYPEDLEDKSVTWKSSNAAVATVTAEGKVTGVKTGTTVITCTSNATGKSATCKVTVGKVSLDKSKVSIEKGKTVTLTSTVNPASLEDKSVTWESSNTKVATVSSEGKVTGVKTGSAIITCTSVATGLSATCKVIVGKVSFNKSNIAIEKGKTLTLTPSIYPTTLSDKSVTWMSSNTKVATVTADGKVTGVKTGSAIITCTSVAMGLSATCKVVIGKVSLDKSKATIEKDNTLTLTATVYPTTLSDKSVTWESSDETVAVVTGDGIVTGVKAGTTIITCTSNKTGLSATCKVTVTATSGTRSLSGDDDGTTGIDALGEGETEPYDVYDLSGRMVLHQVTSLDGLPNGVFVVNGRKVLKK